MSLRFIIWLLACLVAVASLTVFAVRFPQNFPEQTLALGKNVTAFINRITLPIKLARLAMRDPDAVLRMPVHGKKVATVSDTWHASRDTDRVHEGQDMFAAEGTPVFSATYGYVRRIRTTGLGGNSVLVTGAGGRRYYYAHLSEFAEGLVEGLEVNTDTVLGFVGNTGNAVTTPPHLHFGMYEGRAAVNPLKLLIDR